MFVLVLALLLIGVAGATGSAAGVAATAPRAAPAEPLSASVPDGGYRNDFPFGQCTWWAAYNRPVTWNGNARDWLVNAEAQGVPTSDHPTVGAIAVFRPGGEYSVYGHVAVVVSVDHDSYTVSEMNAYAGWGRVDTRTISRPDPQVQGFIPASAPSLPSPRR
jgi:surface antigen